jgi:hypothetical protein
MEQNHFKKVIVTKLVKEVHYHVYKLPEAFLVGGAHIVGCPQLLI